MGCGVSKVHAEPSSHPKRSFGVQGRWASDASKRSTPTSIAVRQVDAQVQVEHKCDQRDRVTQTESHFSMGYRDDELDFDGLDDGLSSFGDDYPDNGIVENGLSPTASGSHDAGVALPDPRLAPADGEVANNRGASTVGQVAFQSKQQFMLDAEQRILMLTKRFHLDIDMTPRSVATMDVGVQAGSSRNNRSDSAALVA
ncbi:hypothetical protein HPB48_004893 [Haemaphysalis longicornis]|uniref:Uncharacterized protein n=1 Tax=Haemaphysalis longicornis TaxID=44386 RepID=A0A9J6GFN1_HAELO|nr:hypothetical protein HPB48_004893 [Haemaphysalis longicornis]